MFGKKAAPSQKSGSFIADSMLLHGNIRHSGVLEFHGRMQGDIDNDGRLIIGPQAQCFSNIRSTALQVAGKVQGTVHVQGTLEIMPSGRLYGVATCSRLRVHAGGVLNGFVQVGALATQTVPELAETPLPKPEAPPALGVEESAAALFSVRPPAAAAGAVPETPADSRAEEIPFHGSLPIRSGSETPPNPLAS